MNDNIDIKEWVRFVQMDYDAAKIMSVLFNHGTVCPNVADRIRKRR